jgi:hypothetical protein
LDPRSLDGVQPTSARFAGGALVANDRIVCADAVDNLASGPSSAS